MTSPDERDVLRLQAEDALGRRIVLRAIKTPEPGLLGRITDRGAYLLVEYRDETSGYFWDLDALREVLRLAREGKRNVSVYEDGRMVDDDRQ
jgi:hypothetical protein